MKNDKFKIIILVSGLVLLIGEIIINDLALPYVSNIVLRNLILIVCTFMTAVASILLVSVIWDRLEKYKFSKDLAETIGMTKSVIDSGITNYHKSDVVEWEEALRSVNNFEMFLTFGESWIDEKENKSNAIRSYMSKKNRKMTVVLPDYTDDKILEALVVKYPKNHGSEHTTETIKEKIKSTIKGFWELSKGIEIKLYKGINSSSYYFLNEKCFFSPYQHENVKRPSFPIIEVQNKGENSAFYNFCRQDMDAILKNSQSVKDCDAVMKSFYDNL